MLVLAYLLVLHLVTSRYTVCLERHAKSFNMSRSAAKVFIFILTFKLWLSVSAKVHLQSFLSNCTAWDMGSAAWSEGKEEPSWREEKPGFSSGRCLFVGFKARKSCNDHQV